MDSRKFVFQETAVIAAGQAVGLGLTVGVFALIGKFDMTVLWGGLAGCAVAVANFFFMSLFADMAADKAQQQDVAGGQKLIHLSFMGRLACMFLILALCAKSGHFHVLALVIPLALTRPILTIAELFKKKGGN